MPPAPARTRLALEQACELHRAHQPAPLTVEWHHIIPVAWQLATPLQPGIVPPSPGRDTNGRGMLWDDRGAWLCPTGHRNVHHWIVALTHEIARLGQDDPAGAITEIAGGGHAKALDVKMAAQALVRFHSFGSLLRLTGLGEWGQA